MTHLRHLGLVIGLGAFTALWAVSCGSSDTSKKAIPGAGGTGGATGGKGGATGGKGGTTGGQGGAMGGEGGAMGGEGGAMGGEGGATGGEGGGEGGATGGEGGEAGSGGALPFRLFNTGVDASGEPLVGGSIDPHYTLIQSPDPTFTGPDAIVATHIAEGYWLPQSAESKWIAPSPHQAYPGATPCNASGTYVYRTTFDLTGYDPATLTIDGGWAADNTAAAVRLNGVSVGAAGGGYNPLTAFTIADGFVAGVNTLDFEVGDIGCPNGLRVELTVAAIEPL